MSEDKYGPIPGVMDTIDCLRKEIEDLKSKLSEAKKIADNYSVIAEKAVLVTKELELRFQAARNVALFLDRKGHFSQTGLDSIDQEISAELTRLKQK